MAAIWPIEPEVIQKIRDMGLPMLFGGRWLPRDKLENLQLFVSLGAFSDYDLQSHVRPSQTVLCEPNCCKAAIAELMDDFVSVAVEYVADLCGVKSSRPIELTILNSV